MTNLEFEKQAKRLISSFGEVSFSHERLKLIFSKCQDLDVKWFEKLVTDLILNGNSRIDFSELIAIEKAKRKALELTRNVIEADKAIKEQMTDGALENVLKNFQATNLVDAIQNHKLYSKNEVEK